MKRQDYTSEQLFLRLSRNQTRATYWDNILELRKRPTKDVFLLAKSYANNSNDKIKEIGIDVLAQLGLKERPFQQLTLNLFFDLLQQPQSPKILKALLYGLSHNNDNLSSKDLVLIIPYKNHRSKIVRLAATFALSGIENELAINALLELMQDKDASIRDWATFGIGSLIESDSPSIQNALKINSQDTDMNVRHEAIRGLANRNVEVLNMVEDEIKHDTTSNLLFEVIQDLNATQFLPQLNLLLTKYGEQNDIWSERLKACIEHLES